VASRIIEIPGRFASVSQGLNLGPGLFNAIKTNGTTNEIQFTSAFTGQGAVQGFKLTWETWFYQTSTGLTIFRNRNSGAGVQTNLTATTTGGFILNIDRANFGDHYRIIVPAPLAPLNQWVQYLVSSDLTSAVTPLLETVVNGQLVPATSRTTNVVNGATQHSFGDPPAATSDVFGPGGPTTASRIWMNNADFIDLTDPLNVAKFIDVATFKPAQLGPSGSNPTGTKPFLFMQNNVTTILQNLGSERDADNLDGVWIDAGHSPITPARYAHGTDVSPDNAGLEQTTATLGLANTQQVSLSMWFKTPLTAAAGRLLIASDNSASDKLVIGYNTSGFVTVQARNAAGTLILDAVGTVTDISDNAWHHVAVSINMQAATGADAVRIFVDDATESPTVSTFVGSGVINLAQTGLIFAVLNHSGSATLTQGEFSQFWCDPARFVDYAVAATRANFVQTTSTHIPIDLGDDGSTPTGTAPLIFVGEGPTFVETTPLHNTNKGTFSGTFTVSRGPWISPTDNPAETQLGN
jgi:hypothetical protein